VQSNEKNGGLGGFGEVMTFMYTFRCDSSVRLCVYLSVCVVCLVQRMFSSCSKYHICISSDRSFMPEVSLGELVGLV
jgi:hypothetical protein